MFPSPPAVEKLTLFAMRKGGAMVDEAERESGANENGVINRPAVTGWDPYEVWLTRIRPHQHLIGPPTAYRHTRNRAHAPTHPFRYVGASGAASRVMREVAFLLFPMSMKSLPPLARSKAIEIANALAERGCDEGTAVRIAIAQARRWASWRLEGL